MNGLDFAIIFAFLAIIGLGFFGGIVRVAAAIVAIYIGSIVSAAFYDRLTDEFRQHVASVSVQMGQLFVFCASSWFPRRRSGGCSRAQSRA